MNKNLKSVLKVLMFFAIGGILMYVVYMKSDAAYQLECIEKNIAPENCNFLDKIYVDIKSASFFWIFIALCFYVMSNISRSLRWGMLIEPLGKKARFLNLFSCVSINYLTNLGIPRSGEFVRAGLLSKYENLEPEKVMGTIVTSRILDVICLLICIGLTLLLSFNDFVGYLSENVDLNKMCSGLLSSSKIAIFGGLVVLILTVKYRKIILSSRIGKKIKKILLGFWEGILTIKNLKSPGIFVLHTVIIWVCYYLMTYLMFFSFAPTADLAPVSGLVVFVFGTLGMVIPSPGGMGSYQYLISEGLMLYGVPLAEAFSFANIMFLSVNLLNVLFGIIAFVFLPIYNRNV